jgi:hypothetical protein
MVSGVGMTSILSVAYVKEWLVTALMKTVHEIECQQVSVRKRFEGLFL